MDDLKKININGTEYLTNYTKKFEQRKPYQTPNEKHMYSFIPGTIVELFVKEGQEVKKGEVLLILEAMKMKNKIVMPFDGTIKCVNVKEGDRIPNKTLMLEIE
ncbi:MAG: biotin/lipoyl-binding protein [Marinifilaceae bacterium]|jgi:biotin carboxyl carrier protein|nr:biotin/lipoyl-binding protein [Marinifilaceae bacterium]